MRVGTLQRSRKSIANKAPAITEVHKETLRQRGDGGTSLKRQMIRRTKSAKTVSSLHRQPRAGLGRPDYTGCRTEEDVENFWTPPELGTFGKVSKFESPRTPEKSEASSDEESGKQDYLDRRHSDEILRRTPQSMSPIMAPRPSPSFAHRRSITRQLRTPESSSGSAAQSPDVDDGDITKRLEGLLVTPDEEQKDGSRLGVSRYQKYKLKKQAKERAAKEKAAALLAAKERRLSRRKPSRPLIQPLDRNWEEKVQYAESERNLDKVLTTGLTGTPIAVKDFGKLLGSQAWLNDESVNAYLEWIGDAANKAAIAEANASGEPPSDVPKFIAHNSFFYKILTEKGAEQTQRLMKRKKVPGREFMKVDTMLVPICKGNHWTVGIVRPIAKTIEYLDSFGGSPQPFVRTMRTWLKVQLGDAYIEDQWKAPNTISAEQNNGWDCGVFACTNSFCVAMGLDTSCYSGTDMTQQRRNIAAVLLNRGFVGDFEWGKGL